MIGDTYPILDLFWSILMVVGFVIWIWLLIVIFSDIFRSHDMSGWVKALWVIFVIIFPLIGILAYLIVRGGSMHERAVKQAQQEQKAFDSYVKEAAGSASTTDQLAKLAELRDKGALTEDEFQSQKTKLLA